MRSFVLSLVLIGIALIFTQGVLDQAAVGSPATSVMAADMAEHGSDVSGTATLVIACMAENGGDVRNSEV